MAVAAQQAGKYAVIAALSTLALLIVLTALGWMPSSGAPAGDEDRYNPLVAPDKLGGFPRWYGMADGEIRDALQVRREYRAAAIEASYLPPGLDPVLATAFRAHHEASEAGGTPYGRVVCTSLGVFTECFRTGDDLTVNVLAPKNMEELEVTGLVNEFWRAQQFS